MHLVHEHRLGPMGFLFACLALTVNAPCSASDFSFQFDNPIELGAALDDAGAGQFVMDPLFLGVDFDQPINAGGIIGSANTVIIPEVSAFGQTIIPAVTADTRTGAKIEARINGRAGLEFNAELDLGGLEADAEFRYTPTLDAPDEVRRGQFFTLRGASGLDTSAAFGVQQVDLPSASVGADVIFDVNASGRVDYGVAAIVPYNSQPFNWNIASQPKDDNGNWTLFGVGVDLDNDTDFATLTVAGQDIGIDPGTNGTVFEYEISLDAPSEGNGSPSPFNRDIGSIQVVKPTLGDTLFVETSLSGDRGIGYSIDTGIVRLGVDIDGIASTLVAGASYTDFSKTIGQEDSDINGSIDGTIIDLKYGPELGYRYESSIDATFDATLTFSEDVAIRQPDGTNLITNTYSGDWLSLPEIALLGNNAVDVDVAFTRYEARRTDRGALTIADFLEFEALALSASINVGPFSYELAGIGPAIHERTSIVSELFGKAEIPLFENDDVFLVEAEIDESGSFTLQAEPSQVLYLTGSDAMQVASWRVLGTNQTPSTFAGNTLVFGRDGSSATHVGELAATTEVVGGRPTTIVAGELVVLPDSFLGSQTVGSIRRWEVDRITNDGTIDARVGMQVAAGATGILRIGGTGISRFAGREGTPLEADTLIIEDGHNLFVSAATGSPAFDVQQLVNEGNVRLDSSGAPITLARGLINTNRLNINRDATINVFGNVRDGEGLINDGVISVRPNATLDVGGSGSIGSTNEASRFDVQGTLLVRGALIPQGELANFVASDGGVVRFDRLLSVAGEANFRIEAGGRLTLNGLEAFDGDLNDDLPAGRVEIVNRGVLEFEGGVNTISTPGEDPTLQLINLDNSEGVVHVRPGAIGRISATIENYAGGGAVFDAGEWVLEGDPAIFDARNLFSAPGANVADFFITVQQVGNADTYLGGVDFEGQGYNLEDYDTSIAINASTVTLSGAAYFPNLNTIRENRGVLNLREGIRFSTDAELVNSGEINVENGARLIVNGDLRIEPGGSLRLDGRSGLEAEDTARLVMDHTQHAVEVNGGSLVLGPDAELQYLQDQPFNYFLEGRWTVRESVEVDPDTGVETVRGATVDLGRYDEIARLRFADVVIEGAGVQFQAMSGLSIMTQSSLTLLGGYELVLDNNEGPVRGDPSSTSDSLLVRAGSSVFVDDGGKLVLDDLQVATKVEVGKQGYLRADDRVYVESIEGLLRVDGVLESPMVVIADTDITSSSTAGAAELVGAGEIFGDLSIDGGILTPGTDTDGLSVYGDLDLSATATTRIELNADGHGRLSVGSATLDGLLEVLVGDGFVAKDGEVLELIGLLAGGAGVLEGAFDTIVLPMLDFGTLAYSATTEAVQIEFSAVLAGDFNLDGTVDAADYTVWRDNLGVLYDPSDYDAWVNNFGMTVSSNIATVPEPAGLVWISLASVAMHRPRRRAG